MKRILLVDLAEREPKSRTQLRSTRAKASSSEAAPSDAREKPRGKTKPATKAPRKQAIDSAFIRRVR